MVPAQLSSTTAAIAITRETMTHKEVASIFCRINGLTWDDLSQPRWSGIFAHIMNQAGAAVHAFNGKWNGRGKVPIMKWVEAIREEMKSDSGFSAQVEEFKVKLAEAVFEAQNKPKKRRKRKCQAAT